MSEVREEHGKAVQGPPRTLEEWMVQIGRRLNDLESGPRGIGAKGWNDVVLGPGYRVADSRRPGWRHLYDGRIELRGRIEKSSGTVMNADVVMYLPYVCAPPNNKQTISAVSVLGPATIGSNSSGVCRFDIQREVAWKTEPRLNSAGEQMFDMYGKPIIDVVSLVEVIARPGGGSINGWIGFDNVLFDPRLYVDTLPVVPKGQSPLIPDPGIAVVQQPNGKVIQFTPGVAWS